MINTPQQPKTPQPPTRQQKPWYMHAHLWLVIVIPVVAVCISSFFVYISFVGKDDLVRDDWYMDGKTLEVDLSRDTEASMGQYHANVRMAQDGVVTVNVESAEHRPLPARMVLNFYHVTKAASDRKLILQQTNDKSVFTAIIAAADAPVLQGKFTAELDGVTWRLRHEVTLPSNEFVMTANPLTPISK